jgi:hypothetical protein
MDNDARLFEPLPQTANHLLAGCSKLALAERNFMTFMIVITKKFGLSLHLMPHLFRLKIGWFILVGTSTDVDHELLVLQSELNATREVLTGLLDHPAIMATARPLGIFTESTLSLAHSAGVLTIPLNGENHAHKEE